MTNFIAVVELTALLTVTVLTSITMVSSVNARLDRSLPSKRNSSAPAVDASAESTR